MGELWKKNRKKIVLVLQGVFLLLAAVFYFRPRENYVLDDSWITSSQGIPFENFLGRGMNGYYIDSSFAKEQDFARTKGIELKPGIYEITIFYQEEGSPQAYLLDAENADFKLWQGNYHSELPADREAYTTLIWNTKTLHDFVVSCDYNGDGYILFGGAQIVEKRGWAAALWLACFLLFGVGDFLCFRHREWVCGLFTERNRVVMGGCLLIVAFSSLPMFSRLLFYGHDLEFHLLRIEGLKDGLLAGQFPVKMQPNWLNGYGYGVSVFYGDVLLYIPAVLRLLGMGVQGAYKSYVFLINLLTCLLSYFSFRAFTKDDRWGLAGSFLFTTSVYRLNCIYVRAAVGEYTAMAFMPLYFYGIYALLFEEKERNKGAWICTAVGFTGIVHSHMITSEVTAVLTILAGLVYCKRLLDKAVWVEIGKCAVAVLGCAAGFLVPFLDLARDSYVFNANSEDVSYMQTYGTMLSQVFNPFPSGGGEALAYSMVERAGITQQFSHAIGIGFIAAAAVYVYYFVLLDKNRKCGAGRRCGHFLWWGCLLVFSTTVWFPWNRIQENIGGLGFFISNIQFPWRLLGVASVVLVFFCCALFSALGECEKPKAGVWCGVVLLFAVLSSGYFLADRINDNNTLYIQNPDDLSSSHVMGGEYIPAAADVEAEGLWADDIRQSSNLTIESAARQYNTFRITCRAADTGAAYIDLPLLFYRGYTAQCGGGESCEVSSGENGRVRVTVPGGYAGTIDVRYREAWYWRAAELVSALSMAAVLAKGGMLLQGKRQRGRNL